MSLPTIQSDSFLTLHYRLSSLEGVDIINTFAEQPATLSLGTGQLSPVLEAKLIGLPEGAHQQFDISSDSADHPPAFGERNPEFLQWVARSLLKKISGKDETYAIGEVIQFPTPDGLSTYAGAVIDANDESLRLDFNHPLAGQPVRFEVKVLGIL
jgi:FKBP-type peptidyl-prolyl cis-trans isomerase SlpA